MAALLTPHLFTNAQLFLVFALLVPSESTQYLFSDSFAMLLAKLSMFSVATLPVEAPLPEGLSHKASEYSNLRLQLIAKIDARLGLSFHSLSNRILLERRASSRVHISVHSQRSRRSLA